MSTMVCCVTRQHKIPENLFGLLAAQMNGCHQPLQLLAPSCTLGTCRILRLQTSTRLDRTIEMLIEFFPIVETFSWLVGDGQDGVQFFEVVLHDSAGDEDSHVGVFDAMRGFVDLDHINRQQYIRG